MQELRCSGTGWRSFLPQLRSVSNRGCSGSESGTASAPASASARNRRAQVKIGRRSARHTARRSRHSQLLPRLHQESAYLAACLASHLRYWRIADGDLGTYRRYLLSHGQGRLYSRRKRRSARKLSRTVIEHSPPRLDMPHKSIRERRSSYRRSRNYFICGKSTSDFCIYLLRIFVLQGQAGIRIALHIQDPCRGIHRQKEQLIKKQNIQRHPRKHNSDAHQQSASPQALHAF